MFNPMVWRLKVSVCHSRLIDKIANFSCSPNVHKGKWSKHEDHALTEAVHYFQAITSNLALPWNRIAENIPHRTGIQCQARWTEALDPAIRKGRWHPEEDKQLEIAIAKFGCCWIRVSSMIPTRTQRQCRTRWNQINSQQLKAGSSSKNNSIKQESATTAPINFEFVPLLKVEQKNSTVNDNAFIIMSASPTIDDIIAKSNTYPFSSDASTNSRSSSDSSISDLSPKSVTLPITPSTSNLDILQNETLLFPAMKSPINNTQSTSIFLDNSDFEFLLDCYTMQ